MIEEKELTEEENQKRNALYSMASNLLNVKRKEAIEFRAASGVERRWWEDERIYSTLDTESHRREMIDYATGDATPRDLRKPVRSQVFINISRSKCETAEGRFTDIQLPHDGRNWGLKVTPLPEIHEELRDQREAYQGGQPLVMEDGQKAKVSDVAQEKIDIAEKKMKAMETKIDDQLTECNYNAENRRAIHQAVKLGPAILKGPNVIKGVKKIWQSMRDDDGEEVYVLKMVEEHKPASKWIDCWNFFPDPHCGNDWKKATYAFERDFISPNEVKDLIGLDGYFEDQLILALLDEPRRTDLVFQSKKGRFSSKTNSVARGNHYEYWEYNGDVDREDLEALGVDCSCVHMLIQKIKACVVFINDLPVKVELNTLDTNDLIYDVFQWSPSEEDIWGYGLVRMMYWEQRIMNAAWRRMMDNAGDSSGANVVMSGDVEPADGKWELTGKKIWRAVSEDVDVRKAFAQFQVSNNQGDLERIIDLVMKFIDQTTNMPTMFQGDARQAPETLGATQIVLDANNIGVRHRVKRWDDDITDPHITRYYHWNMQYCDDNSIKGDYQVDARGTRIFMERDQELQAMFEMLQLKQDEDFKYMVDWEKMAKQILSARRLDVLRPQHEVDKLKKADQQQQQGGATPQVQAAQIRTQGALQQEQIKQTADIEELKFKAQEAQLDRQHQLQMKALEREIEMMKLSNAKDISLEQIKEKLASKAMTLQTQKELSNVGGKSPQVSEPVVEPVGRAEDGRAFQE